jgi:hypothetical protein
MRMRCLIAEASPSWEYRRGVVYNIPDDQVSMYLALGKFEIADRKCPHCGGSLGGDLDAAEMGATPESAAQTRAVKRG